MSGANKILNKNPYGEQRESQLVTRYAELVRRIAHHLLMRLPPSVQLDDLIQAGMMGLIEAARNFDGSKGASFETYAGIRIRGAMLDEIRRGDWVPRSVHRNARAISDAINDVERETGVEARDVEVAAKLQVSVDDYHRMLNDVNCGRLVAMEDLGVTEEVYAPDDSDRPDLNHHRSQFQSALSDALKKLPEREAIVLSLYYEEELNLKEIGAVLGVSESRVCQIHGQAMSRLKGRLTEWHQDSSII
ncbi:MAG: RNA polymerase sigma factor FliA [Pseudomonadota bacterium]|uniref:RNA polymerase sigma factor FliA n=1 Tax=Gallaecimonas pentaromativorans TaxID=584787 RepID=A0A3N1P520_9GAMM|nr:RNA polymerase sigma factor FliA [Gallaecimonas pentaromativorans]MED5526672.1 RNA polymerase sigma factor FliA [Pseudomonadota bacterium]ROQ22571.1 RNA polymerase sigma-28 (SigD/FliA/WhiG) subunit [Gallaecimonas pentaromativorans]